MDKGQIIEVLIEDVTNEGAGLGRVDNTVIFVNDTLPGDRITAKVIKAKKNYSIGELIRIITPSKDRIRPVCPYADECGGCAYQAFAYDAQKKLKEKQVRDALVRIGKILDPAVNDIIVSEDNTHYRNKVEFAVKGTDVGYRKRKSHDVIAIDECLIADDTAVRAAKALSDFLKRDTDQRVYGMTVKTAKATGEVMIIIEGDVTEEMIYALDDAVYDGFYSLESVYQSRKNKKAELVAGKPTITDRLTGLDFEISAESFYQVNHVMTEKLYQKAIEYADLNEDDMLLDIYCGIGTIGLCAVHNRLNKVIGIESVREAVIDANRNAVINGIVDARYITGKAEDVLPKLYDGGYEEQGIVLPDKGKVTVILDPPRAGCDKALLDTLADIRPERIVYVSCDMGTMARDINILTDEGYEFIEAAPVDMFPWTARVETVCLLGRRKPDDTIKVSVNMDDYYQIRDAEEAEKKPS